MERGAMGRMPLIRARRLMQPLGNLPMVRPLTRLLGILPPDILRLMVQPIRRRPKAVAMMRGMTRIWNRPQSMGCICPIRSKPIPCNGPCSPLP